MKNTIKPILLVIVAFISLNVLVSNAQDRVGKLWDGGTTAHSCYITLAGEVKCWGYNDHGQLGDGTTINRTEPTLIQGLQDVKQIVLSVRHTCALLNDQTVKCWGLNQEGQLGNGTNTNENIPVSVSGLRDVKQIVAGRNHTCSLLNNGTVKCWGWNQDGQLGDGTNTDKNIPVLVSSLQDVKHISSGGGSFNCSLLNDGTVKCWGWNGYGQLGNNTTTSSNIPVLVSGLQSVEKLTTGDYNNCVLLNDGIVKCWGRNNRGQLGDGTTTERHTPTEVSGLQNIKKIELGDYHGCSLLNDGMVKCWGWNFYGELGNGTTTDSLVPVFVSGLQNIEQIAVGGDHSCVLLNDGIMKCWGYNLYGGLGDGTTTHRYTPVSVLGILPRPPLLETSDGQTTTTLSITGGTTSVFTPTSINFGELEVSSSEQEKNIELEAPNYFGIEDLKGQGGYYTTLQIGELSDGNKTLEVTEAKVKIPNGTIHTIAGQDGSNISVPDSASDFILFDSENPANILERAVITNGKIGKYGVLPHIKLIIAAYQQVGDYEGTITFTIIESDTSRPQQTERLVFEDDFNDGSLNTNLWETNGSNVYERNGILDIQIEQTDAGGYATTKSFGNINNIRIEARHKMHAGGSYYYPRITLKDTNSSLNKNIDVWWQNTYYSPDYCNDSNNNNKVWVGRREGGNQMGCVHSNGEPSFFSNITSSDNYDKWITSIIEYNSDTGEFSLDNDGDGTIDFSFTNNETNRKPINKIHLNAVGWWTGHYHQFDWIRVYEL